MEVYKNQARSFKERASDLVSRMTLAEKVSQLQHVSAAIPRLGVPYYNYWSEASHGVVGTNKTHVMDVTSFPSCLAISHSWNRKLLRDVASVISDEARAYYNKLGDELHFWCPTINLERDPRWGRNEESFGEDPYLAGMLAVEYIKGIQGEDEKYLKAVSTPKHFAMNNSECNRYSGSSDADESTLREYYAKVFEYAVKLGKPESVMTSYNRINGIPASASEALLKKLLREEWGFDGFVVSDCGAVSYTYTSAAFRKGKEPKGHFYAKSVEEAASMSLEAGTDMTCGGEYELGLISAVAAGIISESVIDRALIRVFTSRFRLGLFDESDKVVYHSLGDADICGEKAVRLAEESANESIVLLKNEGGILPLDGDKVKKILVVGPNAIYRQLGGYSCGNFTGMVDTRYNTTPLQGITDLAAKKNIEVTYTKGWDLVRRANPFLVWTLPGMEMPDNLMGQAHVKSIKAAMEYKPRFDPDDTELELSEDELLQKVKTLAADADAVVVIAGTDRSIAREEYDRYEMNLPYGQNEKITEIASVNPNTVVFCVSMGPVTGTFIDRVPALAAAYYGGQAQGSAIANILFGEVNPSGRLSQTWYNSEKDIPSITQYGIRPMDTSTGKGRTYQYFTGEVKFPFGYGLSYTRFEYEGFRINMEECDPNEPLEIRVKVKNTGTRAGAEVVELYAAKETDKGMYDNKPLRQLKGFEKIFLNVGEEREVSLKLNWPDMMFWSNRENKYKVERGTYTVTLGRSGAGEDTVVSAKVKVIKDYVPVLAFFRVESEKNILRKGESVKLIPVAVTNDSARLNIFENEPVYSSLDESVARVDTAGCCTAVSSGTTIIRAVLKAGNTVKEAEVPVTVL